MVPVDRFVVRAEGPLVVLYVDQKKVEMTTPTAHTVAFQLIRTADDCIADEFVVLTINRADIDLPPKGARQLGAALLRKSDTADDFQLTHRKRAIHYGNR